MTLPDSAITQFKKIWKDLYKVELDDKEARLRAKNLVALYRAVYNKQNNDGENIIQPNNTEQPPQRL